MAVSIIFMTLYLNFVFSLWHFNFIVLIIFDSRDNWEGSMDFSCFYWDQGPCSCGYPVTWPLPVPYLLSETQLQGEESPVVMQQQMKYICLLTDPHLFRYGKWK